MVNISTVAELLVKIGGDSAGLRKEIQASQRQLKRAFGPEGLAASNNAVAAVTALGAAVAGAGALAAKSAVSWNLAVNAIEDVTGMSGEASSKLLAVGQMVGLAGEDVSGALVKMSKTAQMTFEAMQEGTDMADTFSKWGIAITDSNGALLSAEQIYANVAARHREMANGAQKTAMELELFGRSGAKLNDMLNLTEDQMATMTAKAERMGLVVGSDTSQAWENITFEANRAKLGFTAVGNVILSELLPSAKSGTSAVADLLESFAVDTKMHGISTAVKNLIPPELEPAVYGVAGAITAAMIPALWSMAIAGAAAVAPLLPLIVLGAAAGGVLYALDQLGASAETTSAGWWDASYSITAAGEATKQTTEDMSLLYDELGHINKALPELEQKAAGAGGYLGAGAKSAAKEFEKLTKAAEQAHKEIYREWVQLTKSQMEQLNVWLKDEADKLEKSKSANVNYERDKTMLAETYAARRKKILEDEFNRVTALQRAAQDTVTGNQNRTVGIGLTGVDKQAFDLQTGMDSEIQSVTRKYQDMVTEFATLDATAKANNIKAWQEAGLAFKVNEDGTVDFAEEAEKQKLAIRQDYAQRYKDLEYDRVKFQQDLEKAHHDGDIAAFTALLNDKRALEAQDIAGRQSLLESYYEAWKATHMSAMETMVTMTNGVTSALGTAISSAVMGSADAWQQLGQSIRQVFADMLANYIANSLRMSILGKVAQAESVALAVTAGAATAAAWAPAAAMVSLATFGGNSGPAMAGIGVTVGFATAMAIPKLAEGGITTGPTLAMIGDNKRVEEAVLPLDRRVFERLGLTNGDKGDVIAMQNIYGDIKTEADLDEVNRQFGQSLRSALAMGV